jgi:hypothetical protein
MWISKPALQYKQIVDFALGKVKQNLMVIKMGLGRGPGARVESAADGWCETKNGLQSAVR